MQKVCGKDSHTRDGLLELFVSVNSGKVKLRVQLPVTVKDSGSGYSNSPTCTSWDKGVVFVA